jgi:predicted transposase/invertase (TIGR01784 family)
MPGAKGAGMAKEILSPKNDYVFKQVFGEAKNADILAYFLHTVVGLSPVECQSVELQYPILAGDDPKNKQNIVDVLVRTASGKTIDIEIQVKPIAGLEERLLFSGSRLLTRQVSVGAPYGKVGKIIVVGILDHIRFPDKSYHRRFRLHDPESGHDFSDALEIRIVELPKLPAQSDGRPEYELLKFIAAKTEKEMQMLAHENPMIAKAYATVKKLSRSEKARMLAEAREMAAWDEAARIEYGRQEGEAKGRAEGRAEGIAEGMEKIRGIIRNALRKGVSLEDIASFTDLSVKEVKRLAAGIGKQ